MRMLKPSHLAVICVCSAACTPAVPDAVNGSFDFETQAFTFTNFDNTHGGGEMTAPLAARMFGDAATCATGAGDTCQPTQPPLTWA